MIGFNNPFNIRYTHSNQWRGSMEPVRGFCSFVSLEYGVRAACILIMRSYRMKGVLTISEIINRFAPKSENNTNVYINFVCSFLGCFPFDIPKRSDFPKLLSAMATFEGNPVPIEYIDEVIKDFNIKPYKCK